MYSKGVHRVELESTQGILHTLAARFFFLSGLNGNICDTYSPTRNIKTGGTVVELVVQLTSQRDGPGFDSRRLRVC